MKVAGSQSESLSLGARASRPRPRTQRDRNAAERKRAGQKSLDGRAPR